MAFKHILFPCAFVYLVVHLCTHNYYLIMEMGSYCSWLYSRAILYVQELITYHKIPLMCLHLVLCCVFVYVGFATNYP